MAAIIAEELTKKYGQQVVVNGVSFRVQEGEIFGFVGPNGSGKTTTIRMLCGLTAPTGGRAWINGYDVLSSPKQCKLSLGYMSQQFSLYGHLTAEQNLDFYAQIYGLRRAEAICRKRYVIELVGLGQYLKVRAFNLSGGWRQRLALACALMHEPAVVFLDEPTAGVDPVARRALWDLITSLAAHGTTFFVTTHYSDEVERCHSVGYIYRGNLVAAAKLTDLRSLPQLHQSKFKRVELRCYDSTSAAEFFKSKDYVSDISISGRSVILLVPQTVTTSEISRDADSSGIVIEEMDIIRPSIEDIFVTLTDLEESRCST